MNCHIKHVGSSSPTKKNAIELVSEGARATGVLSLVGNPHDLDSVILLVCMNMCRNCGLPTTNRRFFDKVS